MLFDGHNLRGEKNEHLILLLDLVVWSPCNIKWNIKSIQEEELFKIWVGSFMISLKPKLAVKMSIFDPSIVVVSSAYDEFDFALKSPRRTIIYRFLSPIWSILNSKFSKNFSNSSLFWLGDL